jgi:hypothetical protein
MREVDGADIDGLTLDEQMFLENRLKGMIPTEAMTAVDREIRRVRSRNAVMIDASKTEKRLKKHILENMLYMCELNKKNIEVSRKVFDPENLYALNLYQGRYLDLDPYEEWGVEKFDVILGNNIIF